MKIIMMMLMSVVLYGQVSYIAEDGTIVYSESVIDDSKMIEDVLGDMFSGEGEDDPWFLEESSDTIYYSYGDMSKEERDILEGYVDVLREGFSGLRYFVEIPIEEGIGFLSFHLVDDLGGDVLGHYSSTLSITLERWLLGSSKGLNVFEHEVGHFFGLGHDYGSSVMRAYNSYGLFVDKDFEYMSRK